MTRRSPVSLAERVLRNACGDRVTLLNYGARLTRIELQLPEGMRNVVLGYEDFAGYLTDPYFMGATIGRTCNRIAGAQFNLGGVNYPLDANEGENARVIRARARRSLESWATVARKYPRRTLGDDPASLQRSYSAIGPQPLRL